MPGLDPGIHVFGLAEGRRGWHRNSGLPEFRMIDSTSRVNPTCGDKPGHDGAFSRADSAPRFVCALLSPRARGTPGTSSPHGPVSKSRKTQEIFPQGAGHHPASRARCLRLAPHEPRWTYRAPLSAKPMLYPPLAGLLGFVPRVWQRREQAAKEGPCDARQARRARAAWAAARGCVTPCPRPPRPTPRQKNALETPLGWGGIYGM